MSMYKWLMVAMVLCSTVSLSKAVGIVCMDNFCDGNPDLTINTFGFVEKTEVGLFQVMGGERYSSVKITSLTKSSASMRIHPSGQQMLLSSDFGVEAEWTLVYGKNTDLNEDFGGADPVLVDWAGWTDDDADVTITLLSDNDGGAQQAQVTKTTIGGPAAQIMEFTFAEFLVDNPNMAFDDIDRVTFFVEGRPDWDGAIEVFSPPLAPEPASMTLLGVAGMALIRRRRRR